MTVHPFVAPNQPNKAEDLRHDEDLVERLRGAEAAILLPTLNEEAGLRRVLTELFAALDGSGLDDLLPILIDGGSTDGTVEVARAAGVAVLHQRSKGKGAAVVEAFDRLGDLGVKYAIVLDADATYPPDRVPPTLALLREGADLVIGVRNAVWGAPSDLRDLVHRAGNLFLSGAASLMSRRTVLDLCSGFWAVPTARFRSLGISSSSFAIEAELVLKSIREGYSVWQIPVAYRERIGEAKLRAVRDGFRIFLSILTYGRRNRTVPADDSFLRDAVQQLLSIGVIAGASSATVESHPSRSLEAARLVRDLSPAFRPTFITMGAVRPDLQPPTSPAPAEAVQAPEVPLFISLPSAGTEPFDARSMTVSIRSQRRRLLIELSPPARGPSDHRENRLDLSAFSRAGGYASPAAPHGSATGRVFRSRLDFDPVHRRRALLAANGFAVTMIEEPSVTIPRLPDPIEPPRLSPATAR